MTDFTRTRTPETPDEIWFCEHPPVFTMGRFGAREHLLDTGEIPVIETDRGGQVTYHGPGQLMIYTLLDLRRRKLSVRAYVHRLEDWILQTLQGFDVTGHRLDGKPGIYVHHAKICSLGLRVTRGCTFHGAALNVAMDLSPFQRIDPCGYPGQVMTDLASEVSGVAPSMADVQAMLVRTASTSVATASGVMPGVMP